MALTKLDKVLSRIANINDSYNVVVLYADNDDIETREEVVTALTKANKNIIILHSLLSSATAKDIVTQDSRGFDVEAVIFACKHKNNEDLIEAHKARNKKVKIIIHNQ